MIFAVTCYFVACCQVFLAFAESHSHRGREIDDDVCGGYRVRRAWVHCPASQADGGQAMWNSLSQLEGPTLLATAVAALGASVRAAFRYPYVWRYLEFRCRCCCMPPVTPVRRYRSRCCHRRIRQHGDASWPDMP